MIQAKAMLNNREWALLIWLAVALAFMLSQPNIRSSLIQIASGFLQPKVAGAVALMAIWVGAVVWFANHLGIWDGRLTGATVVWFFGTALVLMFSVNRLTEAEGQFSEIIIGALRITVFVEVFINLYVFPLPVELALLPLLTLLTLLSVVAASESRFWRVKILVDLLLGIGGATAICYVLIRLLTGWESEDKTHFLEQFALPVWLTLTFVPFIWVFGLYVAYEKAFVMIDFRHGPAGALRRAKLALAAGLRLRISDVSHFNLPWAERAVAASSFDESLRVIRQYIESRRARELREAERLDLLKRYAGVTGKDQSGRRLDRREFDETRDALLTLASAQMGWYNNHGRKYRPELLTMLEPQFVHSGLPAQHGISLHVDRNGKRWWAWRRTVTGWYFAIGAAGPPPDQRLYDGEEPPGGPPGQDPKWTEGRARNW